jgi:hypothetical protein
MLISIYFPFQSDEESLVCLLQSLLDMDVTYEVLIVIISFFSKISSIFSVKALNTTISSYSYEFMDSGNGYCASCECSPQESMRGSAPIGEANCQVKETKKEY